MAQVSADGEATPRGLGDSPRNGIGDWVPSYYTTSKVVVIRDARIGIIYWGLTASVFMYILIVAIGMHGRHAWQVFGVGTVLTKFYGKAFSADKVFDATDLRFPVIEPWGAFIMTRRVMVQDQKKGTCVNWDNPTKCTEEKPCPDGQTCGKEGYCEVQTWCPSLGDKNVDTPPDGAVAEEMEGLENTVLSINAGIAFPELTDTFFVAGKYHSNPIKYITLGDLLKRANVKLEDVSKGGAIIGVAFLWTCETECGLPCLIRGESNPECEPEVVIKRLDKGQGFHQKRPNYKGEETRDAVYMFGLRILVESAGIGRAFSFTNTVIQVGSCLSLLRAASMISDQLMRMPIWGEERRKAYYKCKVEETDDYSDLQDRLTLVKQEAQSKMKDEARQAGSASRPSGAGTHVRLGIGAGARGGSGAVVMRGRQ